MAKNAVPYLNRFKSAATKRKTTKNWEGSDAAHFVFLVVLAWASGPIYTPKPLPPAAASAAEAPAPAIDFDGLHSQARQALDQLRQHQALRTLTVASAN